MAEVQQTVSRRDRKKAERLSSIYETSLGMFAEKGFDKVTVEAITEELDISKGTFFNYFATKEDVLLEYHRRLYDEMHEFAEGLRGESGLKLFRQYFRKLCRIISRDGERYRVLHLVTSVRAELRDQGRQRFDRVFEHYQRFIVLAIGAGEISEETDTVLLADFVRDLWQGNLHAWVMQRSSKSLEGAMMAKLDFLFDLLVVNPPARRNKS